MLQNVKNKLSTIKNPNSGKSFDEEGRWQKVAEEEGVLKIVYDRTDITPGQKKLIEGQIVKILESDYQADKIFVLTISKNSQEVFSENEKSPPENKATENKESPTQLKVGHGTNTGKKAVPGVKKVIAIGSGKGGVGKSSFTANLAATLKNKGFKVGVVDSDIYGPSLPMLFNKSGEKPFSNDKKKIIPLDAYGIKLMSFGLFIGENEPVIWRGPMLGGVLNQFLFDVDWEELDYLLLDLPPGTGDIQLSMAQNLAVDGAIVISTPQDVALLDAIKGFEMFKKLNIPLIGMVENMSSFVCDGCGKEHFLFGKDGVTQATQKLETSIIGKIPLELELRECSDKGRPYMLFDEYQERPVYQAYEEIADNVHRFFDGTPHNQKKGIFSKMFKR